MKTLSSLVRKVIGKRYQIKKLELKEFLSPNHWVYEIVAYDTNEWRYGRVLVGFSEKLRILSIDM